MTCIRHLRQSWDGQIAAAAALAALLGTGTPGAAQQRVLGIDVSAWQGNISTTSWATLKRATDQQVGSVYGDGRDFVFIRSTRGGTTGEDHRQGGYPSGNNTFYNLSQRYDDPYYVQNINRATAAGLFAGTYHFARPDVIASTLNSDGVTTAGVDNTGTDEANHMLQMASPWMRPGYLPPVLDLEAGDGIRSDNAMAQFCLDFSDRIYAVMGIRPATYINGNYAAYVLQTASPPLPAEVVSAFPTLWSARWPNQSNPDAIDVQNGNPKDSYTPIYGPWDDPPNPVHPWAFWQYASTARINMNNQSANIDVDVAHGGLEFVKDMLIPALWVTDSDGQWTTLLNWNSGQTPQAPVPGTGQLTPVGTQTLPTPRLPAANDTVILDRPSASVTVTLASGTQNIRKLYLREALNLTGGSLTINYVPSWDSTTIAAEFSGPVTLSGSASLSVHTLQVDAAQTFTLSGGSLTFNTINLMPDSATPGKIAMGGDMNFYALTNGTATIANGSGSGNSGFIDLGGAPRAFNVANGMDLFVTVPISNGGLTKTGLGTLHLDTANTYAGGTILAAGNLLVENTAGSATGSGGVTVNGGTLTGTGSIAGAVSLSSGGTIAPGTASSMGTLTLGTAPAFDGTNFIRIDRNGGSPLSDKLVLSSGTLSYGGTLVISNTGAALMGGEVFTAFSAPAYSGAFVASRLPALNAGLNWYLGGLTANGTIKVNRQPVAGPLTFTAAAPLTIPIASLTANATDPDGDPITLAGVSLTTNNGTALVTNSTSILYSGNPYVADRFTYTVSDGHGGTATNTVDILPLAGGEFADQPTVSGNATTLHCEGTAGWTCYIDRSTNFPVWLTISTNVMPATGVLDYTDDFHDLSEPPPSAFYRLRWAP